MQWGLNKEKYWVNERPDWRLSSFVYLKVFVLILLHKVCEHIDEEENIQRL